MRCGRSVSEGGRPPLRSPARGDLSDGRAVVGVWVGGRERETGPGGREGAGCGGHGRWPETTLGGGGGMSWRRMGLV